MQGNSAHKAYTGTFTTTFSVTVQLFVDNASPIWIIVFRATLLLW